MRNKKIISLAIGIFCLGSCGSVNANKITQFKINPDTQHLFVEGQLDIETSGALIDFNMNSAENQPVVMRQTVTDSNGKYSFDIDLESAIIKGGKFSATVYGQIEDSVTYKNDDGSEFFEFYTKDELNKIILQLVQNKNDTNKLIEIINTGDNANNLSYADSRLRKLFDDGRVKEVVIFIQNDDFNESDIMNELQRAAVIKTVEDGNIDEIKKAFTDDFDLLSISDNVIYKNLTSELNDEFYDRLAKSSVVYDSTEKFIEDVEDASVITQFYNVKGTDAIYNTLTKNSSKFNFEKFNSDSNDKASVLKKIDVSLEVKSISTISDIQKILDTVIKTGSNTSGKGGGGSSGSNKVTTPGSGSVWNDNKVIPAILNFKDLDNYAWAKEDIDALVAHGVINGYSNDIFAPDKQLSRSEVCKMCCLVFGLNYSSTSNAFKDINENDWFNKYVQTLYDMKIVNGVGDDEFKPNDSITRQDMCVMVYRLLANDNPSIYSVNGIEFGDKDEISDYALDAVGFLSEKEIINGYNGSFAPKQPITRAEAAVIMNRVYNYRNGVSNK